jgi:hypothetical protein
MTPGAQSAWKIACNTAAAQKVDNDVIADSGAAYWHKGAARTVTVTPTASTAGPPLVPNKTITFAASAITSADLRRPISGGCISGGAFIQTIVNTTTATLSIGNKTSGCAAVLATIEYTNSRVLQDATCTASPAGVITSASALFTAADVGRSVTGGPFKDGSRVASVVGNTATVKLAASAAPGNAACTSPAAGGLVTGDTLTIGATTYSPATSSTVVWNTDPQSVDMVNSTANGQAFSCAVVSAHAVYTETAAATAMGQAFNTSYVGLKVVPKGTAVGAATSVTSATATALTTAAATCPAGITATVGELAIGQPGANAPRAGSNSMASLSAELNLNPALVSTQDDCNLNTFEGFQVIGTWNNPVNAAGTGLGYAETTAGPPPVTILGAGTLVSTAQILFPTAVVSFAGYIRPQRTGGLTVVPAGSHSEFVFPSLPTTLAVCLNTASPPTPLNATQLTFGFQPTVLSTSPSVPTASGNPSDPSIRALGPQNAASPGFATSGTYLLKNGAATVAGPLALPACNILPRTTTPPPINCNGG